ncbi:MAG TPA: pseudouridine synthase [Polyangiaceae bacterium]|nr:pseudouridine synthase [Polyangiaceae bacterium]
MTRPIMATIRLQKVLARAGVASRRAAEALIAAGRVRVDGRVVTEMGTKVEARNSRVEVDGLRIVREQPVYVMLHKPRGVVSTMHDPEGRPSVKELLADVHARVFPVGRLDFNTSGVLLATNDGEFSDALLHPRRTVPKTYVCKVQGVMNPADLDRWRHGVDLEDGKTRPAKLKLLRHEGDKTWLELTITEGKNQQIRRMGDATHFRVMRLARTSFAGVTSESLPPGRWRYLTLDELKELKKEYGVPKRVVSPPPMPLGLQRAAAHASNTTDTHGRQVQGARRPAPERREDSPRHGGDAPRRREDSPRRSSELQGPPAPRSRRDAGGPGPRSRRDAGGPAPRSRPEPGATAPRSRREPGAPAPWLRPEPGATAPRSRAEPRGAGPRPKRPRREG